jgi:hypothetical protein
MIRDTCEIDDGNNECGPRAYFIPTSDEIQAACVEIQSCWTDDIRNSRRVLSMRSLGSTSEMECIRGDDARTSKD